MPTRTVTRRLEFDAAHRVLHHESKCKHLHGHRYQVLITISAPGLDDLGRVIDFGVVKSIVGKWIDQNWDHNIILHKDDPLAKAYEWEEFGEDRPRARWQNWIRSVFADKTPFIMESNPTAENLASELFRRINPQFPSHITIKCIRIYETPNCYADFEP